MPIPPCLRKTKPMAWIQESLEQSQSQKESGRKQD